MGRSHGIEWNDTLIKENILFVMEQLGINRMPSCSEIKSVFEDSKLANAIKRHGGYKYWSDKLHLPMKESETKTGKQYETYIYDLLIDRGFNPKRMTTKYEFDILVNDKCRIDVKSSSLHTHKDGYEYYSYRLGKNTKNTDIFICVMENNLTDIYIIPKEFIGEQTQISMGINSAKYHKFINKWDLINNYMNRKGDF